MPPRLLVALLALAPLPGAAAEHSVRPDGSGDFPTIQAAVDAAAAGDTIVLEDGTFTGAGNRDVRFAGKDLIVVSRNGPAATTIDSQGSSADPHRAFRLDAGETAASRIEGVTITGGYVRGPFPESGGGGILVAYGSHPVITNCVFDSNEAGFEGFGAGLLAWEDCDITLTDCVFVNGVSGWYGGGFVLRKFCDAVVERCVVDHNYALHGGGGGSITNSNAIVTDCSFTNNWTTEAGAGGCLVKAGAEPVFTRCVFAGNSAWGGGGIGMGNFPNVTAIDCLFEGNYAFGGGGGAIHADTDGSQIAFTNCTFVNNGANGVGQHLLVAASATVTARNSIFDAGCPVASVAQVILGGTLDVDCSLVAGGAAALVGPGSIVYGSGNLDADPMFCAPSDCDAGYPSGDFTLDSASPAAPSWNPCGLVGAYPVACGATPVRAGMTVRSWGGIKSLYRGR